MAGYTRVDTINNIADGNVINAADLDGEFDGIQAAFNSSTGHNHDGTAGEGAPILALGPVQDVTISTTVLGVKTTNTVDIGTTGLRFKDFYLAGNASVSGTLGVSGVATFSASPVISVTDNTNAALRITQLGTGNALLVEDSTNPDSTPFVIDASGNVVVGATTAPAIGGASIRPFSVVQTNSNAFIGIGRYTADTGGAGIVIQKSRGTTVGDVTTVQNNDVLGSLYFAGADGTSNTFAALISSAVDGTPGTNDMPGRLVFSTTADGASTPTERMRIDSAGQTKFSYNAVIETTDNTNAALRITQLGTGNALLVEDSANPDSTPFVIDATGVVVVGATTSSALTISGAPQLSQGGTTAISARNAFSRWDVSATGFAMQFGKSRSGTVGTFGIVSSGDSVGQLQFFGDDGTAFVQLATIGANVDGTPGTNDMPGRLVFSTTADGASTPTERMRIDSAGKVGIGSTSIANYGLRVGSAITGGTSAFGIGVSGAVQSDVTTAAYYIRVDMSTPAASFTASSIAGFHARQGTFGLGSTVTNQYGFHAESTLTGATNNYGFYSNIASGTGRYNFYAAGTAENFFGGNTVVSVTDNTNAALRITQLGTGNALLVEDSTNPDSTPFVIDSAGNVIQGTTASATGGISGQTYQQHVTASISSAGALFAGWNATQPNSVNIARSTSGTIGSFTTAPSGTASGIKFFFDDGTAFIRAASIDAAVDGTAGTNDMPGRLVFSTTADGASTPTERMRITSLGTIGIGGSPANYQFLGFQGTAPASGGLQEGFSARYTIPSGATTSSDTFLSRPTTEATSFTLPTLRHFYANPASTFGAGSTVTDQYGFQASANLIGATNNYGFFSNIASGTGRWNFYAGGTADNYFAGDVGIGTTTPITKLEVAGNNNITWSVTASITGTTMDVTAVATSGIAVGDLVFGANIQAYTRVTALGTGTGGIGTYTVSVSQTAASGSVTGGATYGNTLIRITDTDTAQNIGQPTGGLQFFTSDGSSPTAGVGAYVAALAESVTPDTALVFGTRDNGGGGIDANERMRIDSSGNVVIGYTATIAGSSSYIPPLQVSTGNTNNSGVGLNAFSAGSGISFLHFNRSKSNTIGTNTLVSNSDILGTVRFSGADGTNYIQAASITAAVDGTPGTNDMPGRLIFSTTADGASTPTERMRIDSSGNVLVTNPAGLGYGTGSGGTVTQATSRTTGVTINKPTGAITLFTTTGSATWQSFTVTNSAIAATDTVVLSIKSGASNFYSFQVGAVGAGSFVVNFAAVSGTASDTPVINFAVIKGATS